jgi:DNA invertase Pin-like site-specific DNA recombinase
MKYVAYLRVSTKRQGDSGLGLDAQRAAIYAQVGQENVVAEYLDVESGTKTRTNMWAAVKACKAEGATLVVAKLDRLARNMKLACELLASQVKILVCGMPEMSTLVFHILCAVAEEEARMISARTKAGLAEAKKRGTKLGGIRERKDGMTIGVTAGIKIAAKDPRLVAQVQQLRDCGNTFDEIADKINSQGYTAPKGGRFTKAQIRRLLD